MSQTDRVVQVAIGYSCNDRYRWMPVWIKNFSNKKLQDDLKRAADWFCIR